ncbi:hypothetical protein N9L06_06645 [Mariniblastus sp.]|nr:hypothetical protein [Mariniblastus sp.]
MATSFPVLVSDLLDNAFGPDTTTFAIWRLNSSSEWSTGEIEFPAGDYKDGSTDLLAPITYTPGDLTEWLSENYETDVESDIIKSVLDGHALSDAQMAKLNPSSPIHEIRNAVRETGWPTNVG